MAKKKNKEAGKIISQKKNSYSLIPLPSFRYQWIIIICIGFIFYVNTLSNKYALDDQFVILMNPSVEAGFSGIPRIFASDIYEDLIKQATEANMLAGGRYRPLSIATFAIDQQLFGGGTTVRHLLNVLLYLLSLFFLLQLMSKYIFPANPLLAFLTTLLFTIHPIHTEVVANIKSRDEILSFLFVILTFIYVFKYSIAKKTGYLVAGMIYFFLALLSKEYAVTLLALIPLSLYLFRNAEIKSVLKAVIPFTVVFAAYIAIRLAAVGFQYSDVTDLLNNPYLLATPAEKWATKIFVLLLNLKLLIFPYPLAADYGYNQIPYRSFASAEVWLSVFVYAGIIAAAFILLLRKHPLSFALFFFLGFLFLVSNFILDIGATMGERLLYHSSLGVAIVIAFLLVFIVEKINAAVQVKRVIFYTTVALLIAVTGAETISRNKNWSDNASLWVHDVKVVPNSTLANNNAGTNLVDIANAVQDEKQKMEYLDSAVKYLTRALELNPKWLYPYLNLAHAYISYPDLEKAEKQLRLTREKFPGNPLHKKYFSALANKYVSRGNELGKSGKYNDAIMNIEKAISIDSADASVWYAAGGAYYVTEQYGKAKTAWSRTVQINPNHSEAVQGLVELKRMGY